jgi:hypothetical protein
MDYIISKIKSKKNDFQGGDTIVNDSSLRAFFLLEHGLLL